MEPDELVEWRAGTVPGCVDCPVSFSDEMRAVGRCNGIPGEVMAGAVVAEPEPVLAAARPRVVRAADDLTGPRFKPADRRVEILVMAPCPDCLHEPICALKAILEQQTAPGKVPTLVLNETFSVTSLTARLECDFFLPAWGRRTRKKASA